MYVAYRTAADLLEGAVPDGTMDLGEGIAAYRFKRPSGSELIVLWDEKGRTVSVPRAKGWSVFDTLGRPVSENGDGRLKLSAYPLYVTNGKLDEGTTPTPLSPPK
jgi:hypothetical protein